MKKFLFLFLGLLLLVFVANSFGVNAIWNNNAGNNLWSDPGNWGGLAVGTLPLTGDAALFSSKSGEPNKCVVDFAGAICKNPNVGKNGDPAPYYLEVVTGGTLTMSQGLNIGANGYGILNQTGGTITATGGTLVIGIYSAPAVGVANISGASTVMTVRQCKMGVSDSTGSMNISDGAKVTVTQYGMNMGPNAGAVSELNVSGAGSTLTILGSSLGMEGSTFSTVTVDDGGLIDCNGGQFNTGGTGLVNVFGGMLEFKSMARDTTGTNVINITQGTLRQNYDGDWDGWGGRLSGEFDGGAYAAVGHGGHTPVTNVQDTVAMTNTLTTTPYYKAYWPSPADGTMGVAPDVVLSWFAGDDAVSHEVFFGTTSGSLVSQGSQAGLSFDPVDPVTTLDDLTLGETYYWRVDEFDGTTTASGDEWSFTIYASEARNPVPADGATDVAQGPINISWEAGLGGVIHHIYVAESEAALATATEYKSTTDLFSTIDEAFIPGSEVFWRVDEEDASSNIVTGFTWSFNVYTTTNWQRWRDTSTDGLWDTAANWDGGVVPGLGAGMEIDVTSYGDCTVDAGTAAGCAEMRFYGTGTALKITGGLLQQADSKNIQPVNMANVIIEQSGGVFNTWEFGLGANRNDWNWGTLAFHMTAGEAYAEYVTLSRSSGGTDALAGAITLDGGTFTMTPSNWNGDQTVGEIVINGGTLVRLGNQVGWADGQIASGHITSDNAGRDLVVDYNSTDDKTSITTDPELVKAAWNPTPADGAIAAQPIVLDWTPGYQALSHNVYLGTDYNDVNNATTTTTLTGDIDSNGKVGIDDLSIMALQWLDGSGSADIAGEAGIDFIDFSALAAEWQEILICVENHSGTEYTPAGILRVGRTYYWRIYEVYSGDVVKGDVWSFTVVPSEPEFIDDPIVEVNAIVDFSYSSGIDDNAIFASNIVITFEKVSGPDWLSVAADGTLSGTPGAGDAGENSFVVKVSDDSGGFDTTTLSIYVALSPPLPPEVWADYDPDTGAYNETIIAEWDVGDVHYKDFYISVYLKGEEIRMFCKYAAQKDAVNLPAILNIHGWGGAPSIDSEFINSGYAVMSQDYHGYHPDRTEYTKYPPSLAHGNQLTSTQTADPDVKATSDYIWDAQARRALSYMATQPEVDTDRMGATGFSYGGTLIWSLATDPRLKAVCAFHGMGWIKYYRDHGVWRYDLTPPAVEPSEEDLIYLAGIAPQAYSPYINCPVLFLNGSNDHHGNQDRSYQTLDFLPDGVPWATAQQVNATHQTDTVVQDLYLWMQKWVKGESVTWPDNPQSEIRIGAGGVPEFVLNPDRPEDVESVEIYYALEEPFNYNRTWFYATVVRTGDTWTAMLPVIDVDAYLFAYANIRYNSTIVISSNFEAEVPSWISEP